MLAPTAFSRSSSSTYSNRMYVFEVSGSVETSRMGNYGYSVRNSATSFYQVPFSQMNQTLRKINQLGGQVLSIQPLTSFNAAQSQTHDSDAE
ncbi:MAG: phycobilisome linker polypeptide [Acaryochloridaceae cyanobacterium RL_2_7]|nr:phycobilisome linker polypeptide [Acaryochloridaceae cyanobacterium RL_2_7]